MSVFWEILFSVQQNLITSIGTVPVRVRKRSILLESDTLPIIIVSPDRESIAMEAFNRVVGYDYTIQVTLIQAGNRIYEQDTKDWLLLRQKIRNVLYQPTLPGISSIVGMDMNLQPPFEAVSGNVSNYDVSGMTVTYRNIEERLT